MNSVILMIRSKYAKLNDTQRAIADYLMSHIQEFLASTALEIGEASGTSSASVVRFSQFFGYRGLDDMKRDLLVGNSRTMESFPLKSPMIEQGDDLQSIVKKAKQSMDTAFDQLYFQLDMAVLKQVIDSLENASHVYLVGAGPSALAAHDLYYKLNRIHKTSFFNFDTHVTSEFFHFSKGTECLVAISYSGTTAEVLHSVRIAQAKDIPVIAVCGDLESPLAKRSQYVLEIPKQESNQLLGSIASKYTSQVVADFIYLGLAARNIDTIENKFSDSYEKILAYKDHEDNEDSML